MGPVAGGGRGPSQGALALRRESRAGRRDRGTARGLVSGSGLVLAREGGHFRIATPGGEGTAVLRGKARRGCPVAVVVAGGSPLDEGGGRGIWGFPGAGPRRNLLERRTPTGRGNR